MKVGFKVLKNRPKIGVVLTRDSVCMGDDVHVPHEKKIKVYSFLDPAVFAKAVSADYLPSVNGVGHSWTCVLNDVEIAEIKNSDIRGLVHENPFSEENHVHFVYHSATF